MSTAAPEPCRSVDSDSGIGLVYFSVTTLATELTSRVVVFGGNAVRRVPLNETAEGKITQRLRMHH